MSWPGFDMKQAMLPQILRFEDAVREYERMGGKLEGELRFAILLRCVGGQLKTYLQVTLQEGTTYDQLRENILRSGGARPWQWVL